MVGREFVLMSRGAYIRGGLIFGRSYSEFHGIVVIKILFCRPWPSLDISPPRASLSVANSFG